MTYEELQKTITDILMPMLKEQIENIDDKIAEAVNTYKDEQAKELEGEKAKRMEVMEAYKKALDELKAVPDRKAELEEQARNPEHKFTSAGHFLYDVYKAGESYADATDELKHWRKLSQEKAAGDPSQNIGEAEAGGVLMPTEYASMLLERVTEQNTVLQMATIIPMGTKSIEIPFINGFDESQGKVDGNVVWYWKGEEKQYAESNAEFGTIALDLNKCTGLAYLSDAVVRWSRPSIGPLVERAFQRGLSRAIMRGFVRGTGANQPVGFLEHNSCIEVAQDSGQLADTFIIENVAKMYARLYTPDDEVAAGLWLVNRTVVEELILMTQTVGTGGSAVFLMNGQVQNAPDMRLLGLPLRISSQMSKLGDAGDVAFCDPSQYLIGQPTGGGEPEMAQSIHLKFDYGQTAFRFTMWMDGKPWWPDKFTPERGDQLSPFVKLAERS